LLIALTTEGTLALDQIARLATVVIDDEFYGSCQRRIRIVGARLMRFNSASSHLVGLTCSKSRDTYNGLQDNDARHQNRQPSLAVIFAQKVHQTGTNDLSAHEWRRV